MKRIQTSSCLTRKSFTLETSIPTTYEHVLPEGAHDFDDYDSEYEEKHPELGFTDEQVEAEVAKLEPGRQEVLRGVPRVPGYLLPPAWQNHRNARLD